MDRHPSNGGSGIVECDLPQWCKTRIGPVMIHKARTSPPHTHVRVGETPDRSCDSSLASRRQSSLCHFPVPSTQLLHQRLQLGRRGKLIAHFTPSLERFAETLSCHAWHERMCAVDIAARRPRSFPF